MRNSDESCAVSRSIWLRRKAAVTWLDFRATGAALLAPTDSRRWIRLERILVVVAGSGLALAAVSGAVMFLKLGALAGLTRLGYTGFEIGLALALLAGTVRLFLRIATAMSTPAPSSG
jgi:hypothetical protein